MFPEKVEQNRELLYKLPLTGNDRYEGTSHSKRVHLDQLFDEKSRFNAVTSRALAQAICRPPVTAETGFASRSFHVWIVVGKVALGQVSLRFFRVFPVNITPWRFSVLVFPWGMINRPAGGRNSETVQLYWRQQQQQRCCSWNSDENRPSGQYGTIMKHLKVSALFP
jgi:hypothetical protein